MQVTRVGDKVLSNVNRDMKKDCYERSSKTSRAAYKRYRASMNHCINICEKKQGFNNAYYVDDADYNTLVRQKYV